MHDLIGLEQEIRHLEYICIGLWQCACSPTDDDSLHVSLDDITDILTMTSTSTSGGSTCRSADVRLMTVVLGAWLIAAVTEAATPTSVNTTDFEVFDDDKSSSGNSTSENSAASGWLLDEIQLVKVIVLVVVVAILLLSTCTFVLRTSTLFGTRKEEH